jgi:hypothetical protein
MDISTQKRSRREEGLIRGNEGRIRDENECEREKRGDRMESD